MFRILFCLLAVLLSTGAIAHEYAQKVRNTDIVGPGSATAVTVTSANCRQIQLVSLNSVKEVGASLQKLANTTLIENGFVVEQSGKHTVIISKPFYTELDSDLYLEKAKNSVTDAFIRNCS